MNQTLSTLCRTMYPVVQLQQPCERRRRHKGDPHSRLPASRHRPRAWLERRCSGACRCFVSSVDLHFRRCCCGRCRRFVGIAGRAVQSRGVGHRAECESDGSRHGRSNINIGHSITGIVRQASQRLEDLTFRCAQSRTRRSFQTDTVTKSIQKGCVLLRCKLSIVVAVGCRQVFPTVRKGDIGCDRVKGIGWHHRRTGRGLYVAAS